MLERMKSIIPLYLEKLFWHQESIKYRQDSGELIDENSWLMRDLWDTGAVREGNGFVTKPKKLASSGIKGSVNLRKRYSLKTFYFSYA
jgi:hypothetical protein